jgi:hypothetical protein
LGNTLKNNLGTWGISLEDDDNMLGTHWEQGRKTKKKNSPNPTPKRKKQAHDDNECMMNFGNIHTGRVWGAKLG